MFAILTANGMNELAIAWGLGPTLWVYDVSRMLGGVLFMAAAGYALMRGVHIRADFLFRNWSLKTQATVDATLYLAFYIPAMLFFAWVSAEYFWKAFAPANKQRLNLGADTVARAPGDAVGALCCSCRAFQNCSAPSTRWARNAKENS